MRVQIKPITNPFNGVICTTIEVFDPRVIASRPAVPEMPANERISFPGNPAVPAFAGTVSCIVRCYDANGGTVTPPFRAELTEEQYLAWDFNVLDDDGYFTACIMENLKYEKLVVVA